MFLRFASIRPYCFLFFLLLLFTLPAQARYVTLDPLGTEKEPFDMEALRPYLERGLLCLIESNANGTFKQSTLMALVSAPPETVFEQTKQIEKYPDFLRSVVNVKMGEMLPDRFSYSYELEVPLGNVYGKNNVVLRPPHHIDFAAVGGDIKTGRWHWEFLRTSKNETFVLFYNYSDISETGWVIRKVIRSEPMIEHGINVGANYIHLRAIKNRSEGKPALKEAVIPKRQDDPITIEPFDLPSDDRVLNALNQLLNRGMITLIEEFPNSGLKQISILDRINLAQEKIFTVVSDVEKFPEFIDSFKKVKITERVSDGHFIINTVLGLPLISMNLVQSVYQTPHVKIDTLPQSGDIKHARWLWTFKSISEQQTLLNYSFYSDMSEGSWLLRQFLNMDPTMLHAMNVTWGVVAVHVMKARAEKLYQGTDQSTAPK